jgi:hypothetical protein
VEQGTLAVSNLSEKTGWTKAIWIIGKWTSLILSNIPLALISLPASYGASQFSHHYYPEPWNWILGGAFESTYLGAWIFAQKKNRPIFIATILVASLCGAIFNTLHVAQIEGLVKRGGDFGDWVLAVIHGAPMSLLGLAYAGLLHFSSDEGKVSLKLKAKIDKAVEAATSVLTAEIEQLKSVLSQWERYGHETAKAQERMAAEHQTVLKELETKEEIVQKLLEAVEQSKKDYEALQASNRQELDNLLAESETRVAELQERLSVTQDNKPHGNLTVLRRADENEKSGTNDFLSIFKANPTPEGLLPAIKVGVSDGTLNKWISRYANGQFTLGQAKRLLQETVGAEV